MSSEQIDCKHCEGTGACHANDDNSCDECIAVARVKFSSPQTLSKVSCCKCDGLGSRNPSSERFHQVTQATLAESAKNPLPHYHVQQETERETDKRRFIITLVVICVGGVLAISAVTLEVIFPEKPFLASIMPIASALISGALTAYVVKPSEKES